MGGGADPVEALRGKVRTVPDFPSPGVLFRDLSPLLSDADAFAECIEALAAPWLSSRVDVVCGIEARGFIFGAVLARRLGTGFVPLRKPGKLPPPVVEVGYQLEYGGDRLQAREGALVAASRALIVDDVLATGGTLAAAGQLVERLGATLAGAAVVIEIEALAGRSRWPSSAPLHALLRY